LLSRLGFAVVFTVGLGICNANRSETTNVVPTGQCIVDSTFEMSRDMNIWLRANIDIKNIYMIWSALLMDVLFFTFMVMFYFYWNSVRLIFSMFLFYPPR
jgi:hypothetical protein